MAREKFQTLTEQMFYILLCLQAECCGTDIMKRIRDMTNGRVCVGPGTLYNLLERFQEAGMIRLTKVEGRRRSYRITEAGLETLEQEYRVLYGRNLTLSRLPEAVILPLCPDKGTCLRYDPNLAASVYLENDLEQLLRQNQ